MRSNTPVASIVIPTFNRKDCLRDAIVSSLKQTVPVEVIVMDDGSTDGTAEMMRSEFPQAVFGTHPGPGGPCALRNRGSQLATAPILFPIDDDSVFQSERTVEQTLMEFDHPRVGAVGIPYINVRKDTIVRQLSSSEAAIQIMATYLGASHAIRRDVFLELGGYRSGMFYAGEENDYCIRMLDAGYVVRVGKADPIHHYESLIRSTFRQDFYGRRNGVLFPIHNVPQPYLLPYLLITTLNGLKFGLQAKRPFRSLRGTASGWLAILPELRRRKPVHPATYRLYRRLLTEYLNLEDVEPLLAPYR
jgi:glycosyltransferase involved in cell wall biosynthesis